MTVPIATGLLLQLAAIMLLRYRLGRRWVRHPVALLVLASVVYQGISPLIIAVTGVPDVFRQGVAQQFTDSAVLLLSAGTLALTAAYLMTRPERASFATNEGDAALAASVLDWRLLSLACLPLAVLTYHGQGYNNPIAGTAIKPVTTDLAATFFTVLVVLTAFAFLLRHGTRWFLPILAAQSLFLAAAGERTPVIIDAIGLGVLLTRAGRRPARRQIAGALGLTVLGVLAITGVRAEQGRAVYQGDTGLSARVSALGGGLTAGASTGLAAEAAVRLDGTSLTGAILQAQRLGQPRLPASYVPASLLAAVPSAVWSSKLSHSDILSPALLEINDFGLQRVNFLPGIGGLYSGFLPPAWLIAFLALLGLVLGRAERWLLRYCSSARLVLLAGCVTAAVDFEKGLPGMLVVFRAAVALAVAVKAIEAFRSRRLQVSVPVPVRSASSR
jgi:hypothetical protein